MRSRGYTRRAPIVDERPGVYGMTLEPKTFQVLRAWPAQWCGELIARRRAMQAVGLTSRQIAGRLRLLHRLELIEYE